MVILLSFVFIFSVVGNVNNSYVNQSDTPSFTLNDNTNKQKFDIVLSAKDFITENDQFIDAIVLFNKGVKVKITDISIKREYNRLNGFAGLISRSLYDYLESAWFVSIIEEDKAFQTWCNSDIYINDNVSLNIQPTEVDQLSWGVDWIDAERVWGGTEDARDVIPGNPAGEDIKVAIIDTGIDYTHPDLDENYAGGIDYVNNDDDPMDDDGHGTHVAGIVGAEDNDILSFIGVAPKVSLYAIKVLASDGSGTYADVIAGIDWAADNEMDIINLSLGGPEGDTLLEEAVNRAWDFGIVVVAAAGNYDWILYPIIPLRTKVNYPAKYNKTIAVANLKAQYELGNPDPVSVKRRFDSCKGEELDVSAPGTKIPSTWLSGDYMDISGTSMAAPMVAGTCALILSVDSLFSPYDLRDILIEKAEDLGDEGHDNKYGYGQINAWEAVQEAKETDPSDTDNDGLYDREEMQLGTDRLDPDTDNDGLTDGFEVNSYLTSPLNPDADCDTLNDGEEYALGTNPHDSDTDSDVMLDPWEVENGLNPLVDDTGEDPDGDGLLNIAEYHHNCDPQDSDTDNDGLSDGEEVLTYNTNPWIADTDGDGMPDGWEISNNFNPRSHDSSEDADGDGASNLDEYYYGTDPNDSDTDNDGMNDLEEIVYGTNPFVYDANLDPDGDGLTNYEEVTIYFTNPYSSDTDGDGWSDYLEVFGLGPLNPSDPNDPNSVPSTGGGGGFFP